MFWWVFAGFGGCLVFFPFCDLEKAGCFGGFLLGLVVVWFSFLFVTWKKQGVLVGFCWVWWLFGFLSFL